MSSVLTYQYIFPTWIITLLVDISDITKLRKIVYVLADSIEMLLNCGVGEDSGNPLDCKEIQPVHPKGNQSWVFIGRTDAEAETLILWPPDVKS